MELRRPEYKGATTEAEDMMQHEAALRVQGRFENSERRLERNEATRRFSIYMRCLFIFGIVLFGMWVWRSGLLDSVLDKKDGPKGDVGDLFEPASGQEAATTPSSVVDSVVKSVQKAAKEVINPGEKVEPKPVAKASPLARFEGATVDYWKNAVAEDRPGKNRRNSFLCLIPDGKGDCTVLDLQMGGSEPFAAKILEESGEGAAVDKAAFDRMIARTPYLVAREGRAYFCSPGQVKAMDSFAVPAKGGAFNPSREEFGALMDCLVRAKVCPPTMKYQVTVRIESLNKELPVATVDYGAEVSHEAFVDAVRSLVDDADTVQMLLKTAKVRVSTVK